DLRRQLRVVLQELTRVLLALAQLVGFIGVPGARLLDDAVFHPQVNEAALLGDALPVDDVKLGLLEWRRHLVLDHLGPGAVGDGLRTLLEGLDPADVNPYRG